MRFRRRYKRQTRVACDVLEQERYLAEARPVKGRPYPPQENSEDAVRFHVHGPAPHRGIVQEVTKAARLDLRCYGGERDVYSSCRVIVNPTQKGFNTRVIHVPRAPFLKICYLA